MQTINTQQLVDKIQVSQQSISSKITQAKKHELNKIQIKEQTFYFRNKKVGKGYEFCEVSFDDLLLYTHNNESSNNIYVSNVELNQRKIDIDTVQEVRISRLKTKQQQMIKLKEKLIKEYLDNKSNIVTRLDIPTFIKQFSILNIKEIEVTQLKINKVSISRWTKQYKENGKYGFISQSGNKKGKSYKIADWVVKFIEDNFFLKRGNMSAKNLYDLVNAKAFTDEHISRADYIKTHSEKGGIVSYSRVKVMIQELKKTKKYLYLNNPDSYKNSFMPAFGDMREKALYANHYWEIDSTKLDAFGKDDSGSSTWNLISISDISTGMKVLTIAKTSNSNAIAELLYKSINKLGMPQNIVTDNGKDYLSNHFMGLLKSLGINQVRTEPFAGEQKPFVERHFGTLQNSFTELLNGYKGHSVAQFKAIQSQTSTADRISGKTPDNNIEFIFDIADKLDKWIDTVYSNKLNKSLGTTPYISYSNDAEHISRIDIQNLAFIFGKSIDVKVGKKGIRYNNKVYNTMDGELACQIGNTCKLHLDFIDMSKGYLFDIDGVFITMVNDEKILKDGALTAKALYKHEVKTQEKEWKQLKKEHKADVKSIDLIIEAHEEVYKDVQTIESIGGTAITQNNGSIQYLNEVSNKINKQIEKIEILSSKPNLELHKKALENSIKRREKEEMQKPRMTYTELIKRQALGK